MPGMDPKEISGARQNGPCSEGPVLDAAQTGLPFQKELMGWHGDHPLQDLRRVGPAKPLGYLDSRDIAETGSTIAILREEAHAAGLRTLVLSGETAYRADPVEPSRGDVLYVYHETAFRSFLEERRKKIEAADWPVNIPGFLEHLHQRHVENEDPLAVVLAEAFADKPMIEYLTMDVDDEESVSQPPPPED